MGRYDRFFEALARGYFVFGMDALVISISTAAIDADLPLQECRGYRDSPRHHQS
jgi:hypothetical protein